MTGKTPEAGIGRVVTRAYRIPTDAPESDGTLKWDATTLVTATVEAGNERGFGYTYASRAACVVIEDVLAPAIDGLDAFDVPRAWTAMLHRIRNIGWRGIAACAVSAMDAALWDLKARLLGIPLAKLLGMRRDSVEIYGSGGFTSYSDQRLAEQFSHWVERDGCRAVKMKIGREPGRDTARMRVARSAAGSAELYIDANGACTAKQALKVATEAADFGVTWFEEPVSSDDLDGLRLLRDRSPPGIDIAAGEYGYDHFYFRRMLDAGAVDVLQADATRCGGISGFLKAAALAETHNIPLSAHTAPAIHLPAACTAAGFRNLEWFHDHVRIEAMLMEGVPVPKDGAIRPDLSRPGNGLAFRQADAERFAI